MGKYAVTDCSRQFFGSYAVRRRGDDAEFMRIGYSPKASSPITFQECAVSQLLEINDNRISGRLYGCAGWGKGHGSGPMDKIHIERG